MNNVNNEPPIKTVEYLLKILKANNIVTNNLNFNQEQLFIESITKWAKYNKSEQPSQSNVSEDVEKAAEKYAGSNYVKNHIPGTWIERHHAFKAGAEWQKQQDNSAIGFKDWCDNNIYALEVGEETHFTTKELYNIYLKSINIK